MSYFVKFKLVLNVQQDRVCQGTPIVLPLAIHQDPHAILLEPHVVPPEPHAVPEPAQGVTPEPAQAVVPEPAQDVPPVVPQEILLENVRLRRRVQDLEAIVALRDHELEQQEAELVRYQIGDLGDDFPPPPAPFVRPQPTLEELLTSSMWAKSGCTDPSVEPHPPSSWYLWFQSTPPFTANDNDDFLILEPAEPALSPDEQRPTPYSLPQYVFPLLGPEARCMDEKLAQEAELLIKTGQKIKPPTPTPRPAVSLGLWEGVEIVTVLQAHNLRHHAITDHNKYAIRAYKQLHTKFTDRTKPRSEGIEYLMKAFSGDVRYFS